MQHFIYLLNVYASHLTDKATLAYRFNPNIPEVKNSFVYEDTQGEQMKWPEDDSNTSK